MTQHCQSIGLGFGTAVLRIIDFDDPCARGSGIDEHDFEVVDVVT